MNAGLGIDGLEEGRGIERQGTGTVRLGQDIDIRVMGK
jgi:hypothetical protein